jgi:1,4-alpha-glucan branching enzyme
VTNFQKPAKQNLIVYEALVRDFTAEQNWQSMINKIPYIKGLNVNAIELMPVMEFDGNNSWVITRIPFSFGQSLRNT